MNVASQKKELIKWINTIEDIDVLKKLESIKAEENFDFDSKWKNAVTIDKARENSKIFIENLPWKK